MLDNGAIARRNREKRSREQEDSNMKVSQRQYKDEMSSVGDGSSCPHVCSCLATVSRGRGSRQVNRRLA